jgi:SAM-dependent methyltransferase
MSGDLYDDFDEYDHFVNWEKRLAYELPFIEGQLAKAGAGHVVDAACGTGQHAIALAQRGYRVTGTDLSAPMIERARANADQRGVEGVTFRVAGFGEIAAQVDQPADAVLCLGNSLPHLLSEEAMEATMQDFADLLVPGGLLLFQNRNLEAVVENQARWMPLQSHQADAGEWLFLRFYDFEADGTITFNVVTLHRRNSARWEQRIRQTQLRPWSQEEWVGAAHRAGFRSIACYGDMTGAPFEQDSPNLIVAVRKGG